MHERANTQRIHVLSFDNLKTILYRDIDLFISNGALFVVYAVRKIQYSLIYKIILAEFTTNLK